MPKLKLAGNKLFGLFYATLLWTLTASAQADDVSALVQISHSGYVLNRATMLHNGTLTVVNTSPDPILGPLRLRALSPIVGSWLTNYTGRDGDGTKYIDLPSPNGVLAPKASVSIALSFSSLSVLPSLWLQGKRLGADNSAFVDVTLFLASGPGGDIKGGPLGGGYAISVNGFPRGLTDDSGRLSVRVPMEAGSISASMPPNMAGNVDYEKPSPGQTLAANILVGDGAEVYLPATLLCDQRIRDVLPIGAKQITFTFQQDQMPIRIGRITSVMATTETSKSIDLSSSFTVLDGKAVADANAVRNALGKAPGKIDFAVDADDVNGASYISSTSMYIAEQSVSLRLSRPSSTPSLPISNITVRAHTLNGMFDVYSTTDAQGVTAFPDVPASVLTYEASTLYNGVSYTGDVSSLVSGPTSITLELRSPSSALSYRQPPACFQACVRKTLG